MKFIVFFIVTVFSLNAFAACLYASKEYPVDSMMKQVNSYKKCVQTGDNNGQWVDANVVDVGTGCLYAGIVYPEKAIMKQVKTHKVCAQRTAGNFSWMDYQF